MKELTMHPDYGEIVYEESFWTGKKRLFINGVEAERISKKEFSVNGKRALIGGSFLTGVRLLIDDQLVVISPKTKWYELVLAWIPFVFLMIWGNSVTLCSIFPVVSGALGGIVGALAAVTSIMLMKKTRSTLIKILIGLASFVVTVVIAYIMAIAILSVLV